MYQVSLDLSIVGFTVVVAGLLFIAYLIRRYGNRLESQHALILARLERRRNGGARDQALANLAEQAGKLIDEYRKKALLTDDPQTRADCERKIAELKEML